MRKTALGTLAAIAVAAPMVIVGAAPAFAASCGVYSNQVQKDGAAWVTAKVGRKNCINTVDAWSQIAWVNDGLPDHTADSANHGGTNWDDSYRLPCSTTQPKTRMWFSEIYADRKSQHSRAANRQISC